MSAMSQMIVEGFQLSRQQKHLWLRQQQGGTSEPYRVQCSVLIKGVLDREVLAAALQDIYGRHEILRTTFYCAPGMALPLQVIAAACAYKLDNYDLSAEPRAEQ